MIMSTASSSSRFCASSLWRWRRRQSGSTSGSRSTRVSVIGLAATLIGGYPIFKEAWRTSSSAG